MDDPLEQLQDMVEQNQAEENRQRQIRQMNEIGDADSIEDGSIRDSRVLKMAAYLYRNKSVAPYVEYNGNSRIYEFDFPDNVQVEEFSTFPIKEHTFSVPVEKGRANEDEQTGKAPGVLYMRPVPIADAAPNDATEEVDVLNCIVEDYGEDTTDAINSTAVNELIDTSAIINDVSLTANTSGVCDGTLSVSNNHDLNNNTTLNTGNVPNGIIYHNDPGLTDGSVVVQNFTYDQSAGTGNIVIDGAKIVGDTINNNTLASGAPGLGSRSISNELQYSAFCANLQPLSYNFTEFQEVNGNYYLNLENANDRLKSQQEKSLSNITLNQEQESAYNSITEYFQKDLPKMTWEETLTNKAVKRSLLEFQTNFMNIQKKNGDFDEDIYKVPVDYSLACMTANEGIVDLFSDCVKQNKNITVEIIPSRRSTNNSSESQPISAQPIATQNADFLKCNETIEDSPVVTSRGRKRPAPSYRRGKYKRRQVISTFNCDTSDTSDLLDWGGSNAEVNEQNDNEVIKDAKYELVAKLFNDVPPSKSIVETYLVRGGAGTGKTYLMDALHQSLPVLYTTIKGTLVQEIRKTYNAYGVTLCKLFCYLFSLNFYDFIAIQNTVQVLPISVIDRFIEKIDFEKYPLRIHCLPDELCIFLDEYSMVSASVFRFLFKSIEKYYSDFTLNKRLLFVLSGDSNQIKPIHSIYKENCLQMEKYCTQSFNLTRSKRMTDPLFIELLSNILSIKNIKQHLYSCLPSVCNSSIRVNFQYPVECFHKYPNDMALIPFDGVDSELVYRENEEQVIHGNFLDFITKGSAPPLSLPNFVIRNIHKLVAWWRAHKPLFNRLIILSRTNKVVHKLNLQIFVLCYKQFTLYQEKNPLTIPRAQAIRFSRIFHKDKRWVFKKPEVLPCLISSMYILPLVVGMQYLLLTTLDNLRRGDILYLLGFVDSDSPGPGLIMITENDQLVYIYPAEYEMHLFRKQNLYGFPLCLNSAMNIFNSQGKTLHHDDIYIDVQGCGRSEIYVAMSRARKLSQIKSVLI